jgi:hypothetical protein
LDVRQVPNVSNSANFAAKMRKASAAVVFGDAIFERRSGAVQAA